MVRISSSLFSSSSVLVLAMKGLAKATRNAANTAASTMPMMAMFIVTEFIGSYTTSAGCVVMKVQPFLMSE